MADYERHVRTEDGRLILRYELPGRIEVGEVWDMGISTYRIQPHRVTEVLEVFDAEVDYPDDMWREAGIYTLVLAEPIADSPVRDITPRHTTEED
jgi:hypothetical protein